MATMARLQYGRLSEAWQGEAADFTPLLNEQLDDLGDALGIALASVGQSEVQTAGGRRIDIVADDADGSEFVIENQYGRGDHDHLTRGLAYAVARRARGLIVVAEEHRDEFRAVAEYLNELAELDPERGIPVWLVEARAVRIGDSPWAPLFSIVIAPNSFTAAVEQTRPRQDSTHRASVDDFLAGVANADIQEAARTVLEAWRSPGRRWRLTGDHAVLETAGPSKGGYHSVIAIYPNGRIFVPFGSYAGSNSGVVIEELTTQHFRANADRMFGFSGSERRAYTAAGWLTAERVTPLLEFCDTVARAHRTASESVAGAVSSQLAVSE